MDKKFTIGDTNKHKYKFSCVGECKATTNHEVITSVQQFGEVEETDIQWYIDYQIVKCLGCDTVSFRKEIYDTDNMDPYTSKFMKASELFPRRRVGRTELALSTKSMLNIPSNLLNIYNETNSALDNQLLVLAGIGMRAILESVCKDQNAEGGNLLKKIDGLVSAEILTKEGAEILHKVRSLGNESVHEVAPQPQDQLDLAWKVVINLLNNARFIFC